ncbi:MAG: hypothetical protein MN733_10295 [Nitrososphaera sp.]|nr:hypothetical protein [Nitrososphaera sp.]
MIGSTINGAIEMPNYTQVAGMVKLAYSQAIRLQPEAPVYCVYNTSDRGSRGMLAKRWYDWFAIPEDVIDHPRATKRMIGRAKIQQEKNDTLLQRPAVM